MNLNKINIYNEKNEKVDSKIADYKRTGKNIYEITLDGNNYSLYKYEK